MTGVSEAFISAPAPGPWAKRGACRTSPTHMFFADRSAALRDAVDICVTCPVRDDCLAYAIDFPSLDGVWGGTTPSQRDQLRRKRRRPQGATA